MIDRMKTMVQVLYEDYTGVWSPLERLYYSSSSKILVSRHPLLTMEEVISIYCPQCMARYTDEEAVVFNSKCPLCFHCPCCNGILVKSTTDVAEEWKYTCSSCHWHCNRPAFDSKKAFDHANKANLVFQGLLKHLHNCEKGFDDESADNNSSELKKPWHLNDLEKKIESRQKTSLHVDYVVGQDRMNSRLNQEKQPVGMELRSKRTLRCRHDLDAGKMNILIQPKPSPLDGDSSMRVQKGKWWVKDSSAIHEIPFISVIKLPSMSDLREGKWSFVVLRAVNSQEQEGKLVIGSQGNSSKTSYYMINDLGKTEYVSSTFQSLKSSEVVEEMEIRLEAYEDELLKDETEAGETALDLAAFIRDNTGLDAAAGEELAWKSQSAGNQAVVAIPIQLAQVVETSLSTLEFNMTLLWEHGDTSIRTMVKIKIEE